MGLKKLYTDPQMQTQQSTDLPFLFQVYVSTREEELSVVPWTAEQKESFLRMQFDAQYRYYQEHYPDARFDLIIFMGERIGRLYVDRRDKEIRIIDIALLPEFRNLGVGSRLLQELLDEGDSQKKPVSIHVETSNPAMSLYKCLGFKMIKEVGVYHLMEYSG